MSTLVDTIKDYIRTAMRAVARMLNSISGGRISPNVITILGALLHIPVAIAIALDMHILAAVLLAIFGLFDTLDGELARLQHSTSKTGMLLDSVSDRAKEVVLYIGATASFVASGRPWLSLWAIAACGGSLLVSYVNAWGEAIMAHAHINKQTINRMFRGGLMRFEIRMLVLVIGLAVNQLAIAVIIIAILSWFTVLQRFVFVTKGLS